MRSVCALLAALLAAGCSADECRRLKARGSPFAWACGAQGDEPPAGDPQPAAACGDLTQIAPALFALARDPARPLEGLRQTLVELDTPRCLEPRSACGSDDQCGGEPCEGGLCPCRRSYRPLGELLRVALSTLVALGKEPPEPGAVSGRCVSAAQAAALAPSQLNHACELRRVLRVVLGRAGVRALFADPRLLHSVAAVSGYLSGTTFGASHPEVPATLGRMAKRADLCDPTDFAGAGGKLLSQLTPHAWARASAALHALLSDPDARPFLDALTAGGNAPGRDSIVFLVHYFVGEARAVRTGGEAIARLEDILNKLVYPNVQSARLQGELKATFALLERALADEVGAFPALQRIIACADDPAIGGGALVAAGVELLTRDKARGGLDAQEALGLVDAVFALDKDGQLMRAVRELFVALAGDPQASDAFRGVLAQALCGSSVLEPAICDGTAFAQGLMPALALLVERGAAADLLALLDALLHGCGAGAKAAP